MREADLIIVGGGSAGFGAALAAGRAGLRVGVIEQGPRLGGTAVLGRVSNWEPGLGGSPFAREIYERLSALPDAVNVWSLGRHCLWTPGGFPGGETVPDPTRGYESTLRRHGTGGYREPDLVREVWHGVAFDPDLYAGMLETMLLEAPGVTLLKDSRPVRLQREGERITTLEIATPDGPRTLSAPLWIDASGDAVLAAMAGCERLLGADPPGAFGESVPVEGDALNAVTLVYHVVPADGEEEQAPPAPRACWFAPRWPVAHIVSLPDGTLSVNMLPTMDGKEYLAHLRAGTVAAARAECERRVHAHWDDLRHRYEEFRRYRFHSMAPGLGVRESYRVHCDWMLTVDEIRAGLDRQSHPDVIALADHPLDRHAGEASECVELRAPYGIPFRCLIARGVENLLVAGRCAGFTHRAASSCRLSRTMMALGQAAGTGAALSVVLGVPLRALPPARLRHCLEEQGAILCHPNP